MSRRTERERRDQAGIGPDAESSRRHGLTPMHELSDFRFADGEPDIRGWNVRTVSGHEIGEIEELLVDAERGEVVMLEVGLREGGTHAEVPIRSVKLDRRNQAVIVDSGDLDARTDQRAQDRLAAGRAATEDRSVREPAPPTQRPAEQRADARESERMGDVSEETVVERKPMVEEVVVRRRNVDEP